MEPVAHESKRGVIIAIHVVPRSARNQIVDIHGSALRIRLHAPPVEGAANAALIAFLANVLELPQRQLEIVAGLNSRHKRVAVSGLSKEAVESRLTAALSAIHLPPSSELVGR